MSWLLSFVVALLMGLLGLLVGGVVAGLYVDWYRVSSFEGGSGYFVIGFALLGFLAGAIVGMISARVVDDSGMGRAMGMSSLVVVMIGLTITGVSRLFADIPPTIDGDEVLLTFELRWPAQETRAPASMPGLGHARLGAAAGHTLRRWGNGILFVEDAHLVEGRWVVPGAVEVFTGRGTRLLDVGIGDTSLAGFVVPLPGQPGAKERTWSEWMPNPRAGSVPPPGAYTYRYRIVKVSEPAREEQVGPFTVATSVHSFFSSALHDAQGATSRMQVSYHGATVPGLDSLGAAALLEGEPTTFLVRSGSTTAFGECRLVSERDGVAQILPAGTCTGQISGELLTADSAAWHESRRDPAAAGWLDRQTFRIPGLYRLPGGILDTRSHTFTSSEPPEEPSPINGLPVISLSPDEQSYVWFTDNGEENSPVLCVTNWRERHTYTVPIDRSRMRYNEYDRLDPAWVSHHYEWVRAPDGSIRLAARAHFTPIPYRGDREIDRNGVMSSYYLRPGGTALRDAMIDAMVRELGAERMPDELNGYHKVVRYEGKLVKGAVVESGGFISIGMEFGSEDSALMQRLADRLDVLLATGRFDEFFHVDTKAPPPS
ncbi:MAG: hypothetical protein ABI910_22130 [Gemmatimonadota bacterium]